MAGTVFGKETGVTNKELEATIANAKREEMIGLLREWFAAKSNHYHYVDEPCVVGIKISEIRSFLARLDQPAGDE